MAKHAATLEHACSTILYFCAFEVFLHDDTNNIQVSSKLKEINHSAPPQWIFRPPRHTKIINLLQRLFDNIFILIVHDCQHKLIQSLLGTATAASPESSTLFVF
jgi:hypothetical protein